MNRININKFFNSLKINFFQDLKNIKDQDIVLLGRVIDLNLKQFKALILIDDGRLIWVSIKDFIDDGNPPAINDFLRFRYQHDFVAIENLGPYENLGNAMGMKGK